MSSNCLHRFVCCVSVLVLSVCFSTYSSAEKDKNKNSVLKRGDMVMGTVVDNEEKPLNEINVLESSTEGRILTSTTTDANGDFAFKVVDPSDSLKIKQKGYETVAVPLDQKFFTIKLNPAPKKEEE